MSTHEEQFEMIEDCEKRQERLTQKEQEIIDSLSHQLDRGRFLSVRQDEMLTEIWERATEKG